MSSITRIESKVSVYPRHDVAAERERFITERAYYVDKEDIPTDPQEFYEDFGPVTHQRTNELVRKLTPYQYDIWNDKAKTVLVAKSQKVGLSTSELLHDFQEMILPGGRGKECLIIGQTLQHAVNHLYTLKLLITGSQKYSKYLIVDNKETQFREQQTKVKTLFIANADDPHRPTQMIALPFKDTSILSWKYVWREHSSDPSAAPIVDDAPVYAAIQSRVTNTDGRVMIEGPPAGPFGKFYEMHEQFKANDNPRFHVYDVTIYQARDQGLVTQEFIDQKRLELGPLFPTTYEASFIIGVGNVFDPRFVTLANKIGEQYKDRPINPYALHLGGFDPGFGKTSVAYICEFMKEEKILRVIRAKFWDNKATPSQVAKDLHSLYVEIPNLWWILDGSNRGFVNECKAIFRESEDWEERKPELVSSQDNRVLPRNFHGNHAKWLFKLYNLVTKGKFAVPKSFLRLTQAMLTARAENFDLDKDKTLNDDDLDAIRLMMAHVF